MRLASIALMLCLAAPARAETEIKIATLAPAGSAWAKIMASGAEQLEKATQGRVKIHYYFSGSQGDERDVVRKMKLGQLDGAALTAVGLGMIQPDVLVMQLPFMFKNDKQIDHVREKLGPEMEKEFADAGYTFVAWGDVGWAISYSAVEVKTLHDLQTVRTWVWADDPIVREYMKVLGVNAIPLGVPEVLTSLETGQIQAVYGPPLACLALQWYTKIKYMSDQEAGYGIGALVIRKAVLDQLSPADRAILLAGGREVGRQLLENVRRDNARAKAALIKMGIQVVHVPDDARMLFEVAGKQVWENLAGKVYSKAWLDKVVKTVAETPE